MNAIDFRELDGKNVLVCSAADKRDPPAGRRGTIRVREQDKGQPPEVAVEIEFPEMFTSRAHLRRIVLGDAELRSMLETEHYGAFTVMLEQPLDSELPRGNE